ncbi:hypothetical protein Bresu_2509 [Brevundimonas subvibrioides ATCC 15264]|uniref:Uncharacterized protein n=1 Tax=Brevundimonas subvibrioides (strain ATCC 15264 / DSM 4735 / LMG 14903 / NBRC 16000 / CB 81) TaxID=633149 RepID=D9QL04_BRESC|nr:hypothetical protein Bresu_2509 [Brevundimonas subvibrioides ATCC 15264]
MRPWKLRSQLLWHNLVEARWVLLIGAAIASVIAISLIASMSQGPNYDIFGNRHSYDPAAVCRTYGEGGTVCAPASPEVQKYREAQKERRET